MDKCNDYGPFINEADAKNLSAALESQVTDDFKQGLVSTSNVIKFDEAIQDKAAKNILPPTIITDVQVNTEFYQNEVRNEIDVLNSFFF